MQLHLIDATFELFRAFYGQPASRAPDGREVGAVRGLIRSTLPLLRDPAITHIAAATDQIIESFRNQIYPGYKTGEGIDPALWAQFPLAEDALRALGIVVWPMVEFEADDALATAAARFTADIERIVLLSPDKDLAQCVRGQHVVTHDRIRGTTYDEQAVRAKFGVGPTSIPDLLALTGDSADGFPGIPGWGRKSAAAVLAVYRHIEAIPDDPAHWTAAVRGRERLAGALAARRAEAMLYKTLATLRTDVPLAESLADLQWRGIPRRAFADLCTRLGLDNLATGAVRWIDD
ncbi:MAG TPA: 5'-3' exonuclease H3TH domain-containing protein [Candidatus Dormibacteraeota bacterium]|nr:5'-3' exonuclease H3TH domain-containing protein [Candidatus Dormibacteraeota bacterium]